MMCGWHKCQAHFRLGVARSPTPGQKPRPPRQAELAGGHLSWHFDIRFRDNGNVCDRILKTSSTCHGYDIILIQMKVHCFCFLICPRWHILDGLGQSCEQWVTSWQKCQNWFPWLFKHKHAGTLARTRTMTVCFNCWNEPAKRLLSNPRLR